MTAPVDVNAPFFQSSTASSARTCAAVKFVISTPTAFILARYVCRDWPAEVIVNPWLNPLACSHDCLHIYLAAGRTSEFWTFPHKSVMWVSFERKNTLRFHGYEQLRRTILHPRSDRTQR